jgi:hypothetical protein
MQPPIAAAVSGSAKDYRAESTLARLLGSGMRLTLFKSLHGRLPNDLKDLPVLLNSQSSIPYAQIIKVNQEPY